MAQRKTSIGRKKFLALGAAFMAALGLLAAGPALADDHGMHHGSSAGPHHGEGHGPHHGAHHGFHRQGGITVEGEGVARRAPDMAVIQAGVVTVAKTAGDAMAKTSEHMAAVMRAAAEAGIEPADMQTSALQIWPRTDAHRSGDRVPAVVGYRAENRMRITVRDLAALGGLLDALVTAGVNVLDGPQFGLKDQQGARDAARRAAMADAARRAALFAGEAGGSLGPVISVTESGRAVARPEGAVMALRAEAAPVAPGELTFRARVTVR